MARELGSKISHVSSSFADVDIDGLSEDDFLKLYSDVSVQFCRKLMEPGTSLSIRVVTPDMRARVGERPRTSHGRPRTASGLRPVCAARINDQNAVHGPLAARRQSDSARRHFSGEIWRAVCHGQVNSSTKRCHHRLINFVQARRHQAVQ